MYTQYTRDIESDERLKLLSGRSMSEQKAELLRSFLIWSAIWLSIGLLFFLIHRFVWNSRVVIAGMVVVGFFEFVNIETLFRWRGYARETEKSREQAYSRILEEGAVHVTEIKSDEVAVLGARGDEGDLFIFDVGDGKLFWLHGQWISPTLGNDAWPNDHFAIIRSLDGSAELGIRGLGSKIKSIRELSHEDFPSLGLPKEELVAGTMDSIREFFT